MARHLPTAVDAAIARIGFSLDRMEGSHMILIGPSGRRLSVPRHRELGRGLLRALIRDAGLTRERFPELLNRRA